MSDDLHYGRYRLPHSTRRTSHEFPLSNRTLLEQQEYEPSVALRAEYLRLDIERLARELSEGSKLSDESLANSQKLILSRELIQSQTR